MVRSTRPAGPGVESDGARSCRAIIKVTYTVVCTIVICDKRPQVTSALGSRDQRLIAREGPGPPWIR